MEPEQGIIITADIFRRSGSTDRMVEHPAQRWSIDAPQTIFGMTEHGWPGRPVGAGIETIALGQHAPNHVLIDLDAERNT